MTTVIRVTQHLRPAMLASPSVAQSTHNGLLREALMHVTCKLQLMTYNYHSQQELNATNIDLLLICNSFRFCGSAVWIKYTHSAR